MKNDWGKSKISLLGAQLLDSWISVFLPKETKAEVRVISLYPRDVFQMHMVVRMGHTCYLYATSTQEQTDIKSAHGLYTLEV